jgi:chromosome partitioning protein
VRIVAVANQKGGVGKTTTAIHVAHALALSGRLTGLLDLDPQGNATLAVQSMQGSDDSLGDGDLTHLRGADARFWLLPSSGDARLARDSTPNQEALTRLCDSMAAAGFEWLIVDCPPRMDAWAWTGICLADEVLIPVQTEFLALQGLSQMMQTLREAAEETPGKAKLLAILATMVDFREPVTREILTDLRSNLGARLADTVILRDPASSRLRATARRCSSTTSCARARARTSSSHGR